ncbi:hypothetical protein FRB91_000227 [Serendipita sp. 411]|nr:hypothetical protein FRC18_005050 [Serendipita sp. 400]KAG8847080.1 hypothetical protein FRB91_000227 [Serendipita sp. 411]
MFDNGAFHLRYDDGQVYAVPLWDTATELIPPCRPINRRSTLRPRKGSMFKEPIGPSEKLIRLHALIAQTWYDTGLAEKLVADMEWVDNIPSIEQQVPVLGNDLFGRILQHRLALL